jgi:uncharacterized damage-inducible protein DinB
MVPYAGRLGGLDALTVIAETPSRLTRVLEGVSVEQAEVPLKPGKWSLREVMAHLADCEIAWGWRLRQALAEDHAVLQPFDQDAWSRVYAGYSLAEAWACYQGLRRWNVAFVRGLSAAERERVYTHPERGEERLWTIVEIMAGHDLHHLKGLEEVRFQVLAQS